MERKPRLELDLDCSRWAAEELSGTDAGRASASTLGEEQKPDYTEKM